MKHYPAEFKADAVALYRSRPGATIKSVAGDLGMSTETLRNSPPTGVAPALTRPSRSPRRPAVTTFRRSWPQSARGSASWRKSATSSARQPGISRRRRAGEPLPVR
ncbi:transposase [Streptomyces sp. NPDC048484]|uniref:transposase n=1 Tax=Streptomyces sp. NPDC048484 TaxID=3155146 RepID=UPI00341FAD9D